MSKRVNITCSEMQARLIQQALDLYTRLGCGQINRVQDMFIGKDYNYTKEEYLLDELKKLYFPDLHRNESYGIFSDSAPEYSKVGWDIIQAIRYELRDRNGRYYTVDQYPPLKSSRTEELIKVEVF